MTNAYWRTMKNKEEKMTEFSGLPSGPIGGQHTGRTENLMPRMKKNTQNKQLRH